MDSRFRQLISAPDPNSPSIAGDPNPDSVDLLKATKLGGAIFLPGMPSVGCIIASALQTITTKHRDLRQISVHLRCISLPFPGFSISLMHVS